MCHWESFTNKIDIYWIQNISVTFFALPPRTQTLSIRSKKVVSFLGWDINLNMIKLTTRSRSTTVGWRGDAKDRKVEEVSFSSSIWSQYNFYSSSPFLNLLLLFYVQGVPKNTPLNTPLRSLQIRSIWNFSTSLDQQWSKQLQMVLSSARWSKFIVVQLFLKYHVDSFSRNSRIQNPKAKKVKEKCDMTYKFISDLNRHILTSHSDYARGNIRSNQYKKMKKFDVLKSHQNKTCSQKDSRPPCHRIQDSWLGGDIWTNKI